MGVMDTSEETRRLLKLFGVAVTEFEDKTKLLIESSTTPGAEPKTLLRDASRLMLDLNERWSDVTTLLFRLQKQLFENLNR